MLLFCCVFDSVLQQFSQYFAGVDSKDCCCLFQRTALSHPKCLHSSTPTHLNVREDHVVILMRLFSYLELRHPLLPQVRTHTGTHASKFCTPQCWEQLLQETPNVLVSTHRSRFRSFHSQACHQVSQTAHPILALKLHNLFEGQHANVCYATFDHENS